MPRLMRGGDAYSTLVLALYALDKCCAHVCPTTTPALLMRKLARQVQCGNRVPHSRCQFANCTHAGPVENRDIKPIHTPRLKFPVRSKPPQTNPGTRPCPKPVKSRDANQPIGPLTEELRRTIERCSHSILHTHPQVIILASIEGVDAQEYLSRMTEDERNGLERRVAKFDMMVHVKTIKK